MKYIVVLDLSRYSDIARHFEEGLGAMGVQTLNRQIQEFIFKALAKTGFESHEIPYKSTGDGAILAFESAETAHRFAENLHYCAQEHNAGKDFEMNQRHFRVGICCDDVVVEEITASNGEITGYEFAGTAVSNAARLEAACITGEILICVRTYSHLADKKAEFFPEETVRGKREEIFSAHRRTVIAPAVWDLTVRKAEKNTEDVSCSERKEDKNPVFQPVNQTMNAKKQESEISPEFLKKVGNFEISFKIKGWQALLNIGGRHTDALIDACLYKKIDIHASDRFGRTALSVAAQEGNVKALKKLIDCEAVINDQSKSGKTALIEAAIGGKILCVKELCSAGADVNIADKSGDTALMWAAVGGNTDIINVLLEYGADVSLQNKNRSTAAMLASSNGHQRAALMISQNKKRKSLR